MGWCVTGARLGVVARAALVALAGVLLLGCGDKEAASGDDTGTADTANPIAPPDYAPLWDLNAAGCDDDQDAIVYYLFEGQIDDAGDVVGQEGWYWFFKTEGWEGDCVDRFDVAGSADTPSYAEDVCYGCERAFSTAWDLADENRGCTGHDYETFWDLEDEDQDHYEVEVLLDALTPSGNPNQDNQMLVTTAWEKSARKMIYNPAYARGHYDPVVADDYEGAATLDWSASTGICVAFTTGE